MEPDTDSYLMQQLQAGERAPLATLFERYHVSIFRYFLHLTGSRTQSEDLAQEVFMRVLKYARSFDAAQSFRTWLYQVARNTHIDALRKRRDETPLPDGQEFRSSQPMPEDLFAREQDLATLQQALARLPESKREVLVLSKFQDMRYDEIARVLDCGESAVKVRVFRAIRDLRTIFHELRGAGV